MEAPAARQKKPGIQASSHPPIRMLHLSMSELEVLEGGTHIHHKLLIGSVVYRPESHIMYRKPGCH